MNIYRKEFDCHFHQPKILVKKNLKILSFNIGACHYLVSFYREYVCRCKIYVKLETSNVVKTFVCRDLPRDSDFPPRNCHFFLSFVSRFQCLRQIFFFILTRETTLLWLSTTIRHRVGWRSSFK